jgi:hypothetical protein
MQIHQSKPNHGFIVLAGLIDAALTIGFFVALFVYFPDTIAAQVSMIINPNLAILAGFILYRLIAIQLFDKTPGMKFCKLVFLNAEAEPLNVREKTLAAIFVLYQGVDYYQLR